MATPNRGITELPGNVAPDVPFHTNNALRQVDAEIEKVDTESISRDDEQKLRLSQLEAAAGFPNNPVAITDGNVSTVLNNKTSASAGAVRKIVEEQAFPFADLDILRGRLGTRNERLVNLVFVGSSTINGGGASDYDSRSVVGLLTQSLYAAYPKYDGTQHYNICDLNAAAASTKTAPGLRSVRAGIGGTTSATYLPAADVTKIKALNPGLILHMIGSNDFAEQMAIATYKANVTAKLDEFASLSDTVHILVHQFPREDVTAPSIPWASYGKALKEIAELRSNVVFIDASRPFTEMGLPASDPFNLVGGDRIHATDAGHAILAKTISDALVLTPQTQDTGWVSATPTAPYAHRASFPMQYRVLNGQITFRGGASKADGSAFAGGFQAVATVPVALAPSSQPTGVGSAGIGMFSMRYIQVTGELVVWPSGISPTYVMFSDMNYPLERMAN